MRSLLAGMLGVVAALALALALPIGWVAQNVADEDGYVAFSTDLVDDPDFRDEILVAVTEDIVQRTGLSEAFAPTVRTALEQASEGVVETPAFRTAFAEAQRESHRAFFGEPSDLPPEMADADGVVVDLAPVAQTIVDAVTADLPVSIDAPDQLMVAVGGQSEREAIAAIDRTPKQALALAAVAAIAAVLSLLLARRSSTMLVWLGLGAAGAAALAHVLSAAVLERLLDSSSAPSALAARAQQVLADAALASLDEWLVIAAGAGGVAVVLGLLARAVAGRR